VKKYLISHEVTKSPSFSPTYVDTGSDESHITWNLSSLMAKYTCLFFFVAWWLGGLVAT
jgi:hypothetical protein